MLALHCIYIGMVGDLCCTLRGIDHQCQLPFIPLQVSIHVGKDKIQIGMTDTIDKHKRDTTEIRIKIISFC